MSFLEWSKFNTAEYGVVGLSIVLLCFHSVIIGFLAVSRKRAALFTKSFMEENWGAVHKEQTGYEI